MKTFRIYEHPQGSHYAVKLGWSWPGFLFGAIWALYKKLWLPGAGLFILFFILKVIEADVYMSSGEQAGREISGLIGLLGIVLAILFGVNGNRWHENNLKSRGFELQDTLDAENPEAAIATWIKTKNKI